MNKRMLWSRILSIMGLVVMTSMPVLLFGYALHGYNWRYGGVTSVLVLAMLLLPVIGSGLVALGAFLGKGRHRVLWLFAFLTTALLVLFVILDAMYPSF
ncbi:hypothetical protein [Candidatus Cryosericum terrychapinii]|jgi:hypothetical protein|uniref:Uncharacterized protein n=1 Tax=Candidatus Cryosericum terrychapinii TaxID=2290919 RepID=A0A398D2R4_9BACT|nr:hypothetical protein [Candidatus Cryosericum terrychapinii]RIE05731.1 hypothetical protein SMC7_06140 [Candidatus Cryosericum terrychapinii]